MAVLWERGTASAREIHDRVGEPLGLVYTTTAKVLDRLHAKGLVTRRRAGRSFVYRARRGRDEVERARARSFIERLLGDEPRPALAGLVDAVDSIDPHLLDDLARAVAARRRNRDGP
jgi:BlaI family penicillinase repressor